MDNKPDTSSKSSNKRKKAKIGESTSFHICEKHDFSSHEVQAFQENLLSWYDEHQRVLPWRTIAKNEPDADKRGYAVWVSEIMLQQTQVATVISYFNKWIQKWPTVSSLASASLEDVNKVWAGLGYYSRARRLHEGAKIVMEKLKGTLPQSVDELVKQIPGIGLYSASAIASVAFQKPVGVVDGNVIRVLSRMRLIGGNVTESGVKDHLWQLANKIVAVGRPGDFNQALMELGAVVCTPQGPKCLDCPVRSICGAQMMVKKYVSSNGMDAFLTKSEPRKGAKQAEDIPDIENALSCNFCLDPSKWRENPEVTVYPCKAEKKSSRIEKVGVVVIQQGDAFLMTKRPKKGLLAGLWEFPSILFDEAADTKDSSAAVETMLSEFGISSDLWKKRKYVGEVLHIFSHIKTTYVIEHLVLAQSVKVKNKSKELIWYTSEEIDVSAVSTAMKKVFSAVMKMGKNTSPVAKKRKRKSDVSDKKQKSIKAFFR